MGDVRPDGGNGPPEDGGARGGLPDFPPEWGTIVIPDDASELDHEAAALRRELRRHKRRTRLRTAFGLGQPGSDAPSLGVPVVIMAVAVITTLLSLFVVTWDRRPTPITSSDPGAATPPAALVDVTLADAGGDSVRLGGMLPAVLLLADGCDCSALIGALAKAAPPPVTIVPIGRSAPCPVGTAPNVRCLADPQGGVTGRYPAASPSGPPSGSPPGSPSGAAPGAASGTASGTVSGAVPGAPSGAVSGAPSGAVSGAPSAPVAARAVLIDSNGTVSDPVPVTNAADLTDAFTKLVGG